MTDLNQTLKRFHQKKTNNQNKLQQFIACHVTLEEEGGGEKKEKKKKKRRDYFCFLAKNNATYLHAEERPLPLPTNMAVSFKKTPKHCFTHVLLSDALHSVGLASATSRSLNSTTQLFH